MKVLFVSSGNNQYGINPFIKSQGESLIKAGIDLEYFLVQGKGFLGYVKSVIKLRHSLKKKPVDLLHAHYGLCGWVAFLAKPKKLPLVLSYMGSDICPVKNRKVAPKMLRARLSRVLQKKVAHVIVKSNNLKAILSRKVDVSVIPNGVNLDVFKPLEKETCRVSLNLSCENKIILFLGSLQDPRKNIELLKKAFEMIGSPNLLLITPCPIIPDKIPSYINAADVLVVPSISEGSPNVVKEAMACNCPIVATDVGDIQWVLGNTDGCFLTLFSPVELALKIRAAIDFNKKTNGRQRLIELRLDTDSIAKRIISIYLGILKSR